MSSLRNAAPRRTHRERAQPLERSKWGLLEKSKDYRKRAADHKLKRSKLKTLRTKASERNEDEFYFGMVNESRDSGSQNKKREQNGAAKKLSHDVIKLLKTQDAGYLRTMLGSVRAKRERAEERFVLQRNLMQNGGGEGKVVVLDEMPEESDGVVKDDDDLSSESVHDEREYETKAIKERRELKKKKHRIEVQERLVEGLKNREKQLGIALRELDAQRARMNGTAGKGVNKNGVKFKFRSKR
ncbi:U3 small nucleolar RNA-associated protein 11 [Piedraia hortae CBS 480.64]|uniref:U3 small nucleolar RNA-associated protein 11 n=1 Tax=Piedraia hortae CBS 480.64 TaxID=1314780 RepID=A0A6A7BQM9_9PEZI|nr:U3 small nucleolar RNA-associated protein 11 [Piedraia hortae CBS 480.64]